MGGALTIQNKTNISVVVTLKNSGIQHCFDTIVSGSEHKYDLALFDYDAYVEGLDQQTASSPVPRGHNSRVARNVSIAGQANKFNEVHGCMATVSPGKKGGDAPVRYITASEYNGDCFLHISANLPSCYYDTEPATRRSPDPDSPKGVIDLHAKLVI